MFTSLTELSCVTTEKHEQCVNHGPDCTYQCIGPDCGKFSTTICIREANPQITVTFVDKTAQEAYDRHRLEAEGALDWIYEKFPGNTIHAIQQRVLSDLKRTYELPLLEQVQSPGQGEISSDTNSKIAQHDGVYHPLQPPAFEARPGEFFCCESNAYEKEPSVIWRRPSSNTSKSGEHSVYTYEGSIRHNGTESTFKAGEIIDPDGKIVERCVQYGTGVGIVFDFGLPNASRIKDVTKVVSKLLKSGSVYKTKILTKTGKMYEAETQHRTAKVTLLGAKESNSASYEV